MLRVRILGSGSIGNACLVESPDAKILVDAGLSARRLKERLDGIGCALDSLDAILLTHEHGDHSNAIKVLAKKTEIPIFANSLTAEMLRAFQHLRAPWNFFPTGGIFSIRDLEIRTFSVPHDAVDPVGFCISCNGTRFAMATDLGMPTKNVIHHLRGAHFLLLETNYDEELLEQDLKRPWSVKQRISSRHGHLSNTEAAALIREAITPELQTVVLAHLSEDCNSPERARGAMLETLRSLQREDVGVYCADRSEVGPVFEVSASGASSASPERPEFSLCG